MSSVKCLTISFNPNQDETKIRLSEDFRGCGWITQADVLKDAIYELEELYEQLWVYPIGPRQPDKPFRY